MILVYHLVLKPLGMFRIPDDFQDSHYGCPDGLKSRFSYFEVYESSLYSFYLTMLIDYMIDMEILRKCPHLLLARH